MSSLFRCSEGNDGISTVNGVEIENELRLFNTNIHSIKKVGIPYSFTRGAAVVLNDEIHIMGSCYDSDYTIFPYAKYHYKYNSETDTWEKVSTLPYPFYIGSAVVLNGEIHILGGDANPGDSNSDYHNYTNHYKYNPSTGKWTKFLRYQTPIVNHV